MSECWGGVCDYLGGLCTGHLEEALDEAQGITRSYEYTTIEGQALEHVKQAIRISEQHSFTSCPRFTRAMCSYRLIISNMVERGIWPDDLVANTPMPLQNRSSNEQETNQEGSKATR